MKHPSRLTRLSVLIGVLATVAAACSSTSSTVADPPSAAAAPPSRSIAGPGAVPKVLDFAAPSLGGGLVKGSDYVGKDLAIWFWAPW